MSIDQNTLLRGAHDHARALENKEYSALDLARAALERAESTRSLGAYLSLDEAKIVAQARESDQRRATGKSLGPLDGVPVTIKDNICELGQPCTCASKILEKFTAPYDATVIAKLRAAGAVLFGRANMDEFAMGSSTENSAFGVARNPWDPERVPGGSSGGSAVAVAAGVVPLALGSDTGGSIRQPAAFCGLVGLKPTYGRVSRYGLVAYASSLDQIGPFARSVSDAALLASVIAGNDPRDASADPEGNRHPIAWELAQWSAADLKKLRVGVMLPDKQEAASYDADVLARTDAAIQFLKSQGVTIVPLQSALEKYLIPIYYILATAEASSNLSRYDGVRYGHRAEQPKDLMDLYVRSRTEGFGPEVKRRILLGTFVLSSGYYDAYYKSAQKARRMIQAEYAEFFKQADVILTPTSPFTAFRLGEKSGDPLAMYQSDILTIAANLAGVPALSLPAGLDTQGLPIGLQLLASHFDENRLLRVAALLESAPGFALDYSATAVAGNTAAEAKPTKPAGGAEKKAAGAKAAPTAQDSGPGAGKKPAAKKPAGKPAAKKKK